MGTYDAGTYQRARADGQRAIDALRLARWIAEPKIEVPDYGAPVTLERDGWTIRLSVDYDEGVTLADLGYGTFMEGVEDWRTGYERKPDPAAVRNPYRDSRNVSNGDGWYVPGDTQSGWYDYCRKAGMSKAVARDAARERAEAELRDITRDYGPSVYVLTATASRDGIELGRESVGGIEIAWSPITRTSGMEYLAEVAEDIIPEAIAEAEAALARLAGYVAAGGTGLAADVRRVVTA